MQAAGEERVDPRIIESRRRVLTATLAELVEAGYGAFAIESVSRRSGVAKSTIYRHWSGKLAMVADALRTLNVQPGPTADHEGTAREDDPRTRVVTLVEHLTTAFAAGSPVARSTPALIEAAERDPDLRNLFHDYTAQRRQALVDAVAAAVASGAITSSVDPELAAVALAGAVMYRRLMTPAALEPTEVEALVTTVLGPARIPRQRR
jgi:TetR/AcrR family transcriptional regulator, regulator of autoinduction and epiphytic fitness